MTITATEAKNRFGHYMDQAQREPVTVEKTGRPCVVIVDHRKFERLQALEDQYWAEKARQAERSGYVGSDALAAEVSRRMGQE